MKMKIGSGCAARGGIRKITCQMNQDAFDRALVKLSARLPAYFRRRVSDATVVEDLTQETLLKAFRAAAHCAKRRALKPGSVYRAPERVSRTSLGQHVADGSAKPTLPRLRFHFGKANRRESKDSSVSGKQIVLT